MSRRPGLSMCGAAFIAIEDRSDSRVGFDPSECANGLDDVAVGDIAMPARANFLEGHLGVIPALPMQHQADRLVFTRGDDLFQGDAQEAFLLLRRTVRIVPECGE